MAAVSELNCAGMSAGQAQQQRAYARVGLLGNPSDGYNGQVISFTISNFHAEVTALGARADAAVLHRQGPVRPHYKSFCICLQLPLSSRSVHMKAVQLTIPGSPAGDLDALRGNSHQPAPHTRWTELQLPASHAAAACCVWLPWWSPSAAGEVVLAITSGRPRVCTT